MTEDDINRGKGRGLQKLEYAQAATCAANRTTGSGIQECMLNRWVLRASLNQIFDCQVLMSNGRLFQSTGRASVKRIFDERLLLFLMESTQCHFMFYDNKVGGWG